MTVINKDLIDNEMKQRGVLEYSTQVINVTLAKNKKIFVPGANHFHYLLGGSIASTTIVNSEVGHFYGDSIDQTLTLFRGQMSLISGSATTLKFLRISPISYAHAQ